MRQLVARSMFWLVWTRAGINVVSILNMIVLARLLSPRDFGLAGLAAIWIELISALAELGLGAAIIQFRDLEPEDLNTSFWLTMLLGVAGYGALFFASPALEGWFNAPHLSPILRVASISLLLVCARVVPDGLLRRDLMLDKVAKAQVAGSFLGAFVGIATALAGGGVWSLVDGALVASLATTCGTYAYCRWRPGWRLDSGQFGAIISFSLAALGTKLIFVLQSRLDEFVVGKTLGQTPLGFYLMARNLAMMPVDRLSGIVGQMANSVMASVQTDRGHQADLLLQSTRLVAVVSFPICIGMLLEARALIAVALGPHWISMVPVFQILCLSASFRSIMILLPPLLASRRRQWFLFAYSCVTVTVLLPSLWVGAHIAGTIGVASVYVLVYPLVGLWLAHETLRSAGIARLAFLRQLAVPAGACALMACTVILTHVGLDAADVTAALPRLLISAIVGAGTYTGMVLCSGSPVVAELKMVFGWVLRPLGRRSAHP
ncbi:MAG: lipopolysaccharide biosynthesis protein [Acetobacteraceae bacterium]